MKKIEYVLPADIEKRSFEIIKEELDRMNVVLDPVNDPVIRRVIHTTADFDYIDTLMFSEGAVQKARELLKNGAVIVSDTNMVKSGINKTALGSLGGEVICYMSDPDINKMAVDGGFTRASIAMRKASHLDRPVIFAIGNAPTALITLHDMMMEGTFKPEFVIGVPVGFVNVEAAKELFIESDVPYIINRGRKGGSNVAAAICNALIYGITR